MSIPPSLKGWPRADLDELLMRTDETALEASRHHASTHEKRGRGNENNLDFTHGHRQQSDPYRGALRFHACPDAVERTGIRHQRHPDIAVRADLGRHRFDDDREADNG